MAWADDYYQIELTVDGAAAGLFAGAAGFAVSALAGEAGLATLVVAGVAFRLVYGGLRRIAAGSLPLFDLRPIERAPEEPSSEQSSAFPGLHLVGSRSSRNRTRPTPAKAEAPDASQELSDALAQLRLSLR